MSIHNAAISTMRDYDKLKTVIDITNQVTGILNLDQLLPAAVGAISHGIRDTYVGLLMAQGDRLVLRATSDASAARLHGKFSLGIGKEGISGWVAATGQSVFVPDVNQDPRYVELGTNVPVCSALAVPLRVSHKTIGVLDVDASGDQELSEDDLWSMELIAGHIAAAIENARLYENLQAYAGDLEQQIRQRTVELDEATERLITMKTTFGSNQNWDLSQESDSAQAELPDAVYDALDIGKSMNEESFPDTSVLTAREIRILELIAQGLTDKAIAQRYVISPHTVNAHLRSIYRKLHTHSRTGAVNLARRKGIIP